MRRGNACRLAFLLLVTLAINRVSASCPTTCGNGVCNSGTGQCVCTAGWEPPTCTTISTPPPTTVRPLEYPVASIYVSFVRTVDDAAIQSAVEEAIEVPGSATVYVWRLGTDPPSGATSRYIAFEQVATEEEGQQLYATLLHVLDTNPRNPLAQLGLAGFRAVEAARPDSESTTDAPTKALPPAEEEESTVPTALVLAVGAAVLLVGVVVFLVVRVYLRRRAKRLEEEATSAAGGSRSGLSSDGRSPIPTLLDLAPPPGGSSNDFQRSFSPMRPSSRPAANSGQRSVGFSPQLEWSNPSCDGMRSSNSPPPALVERPVEVGVAGASLTEAPKEDDPLAAPVGVSPEMVELQLRPRTRVDEAPHPDSDEDTLAPNPMSPSKTPGESPTEQFVSPSERALLGGQLLGATDPVVAQPPTGELPAADHSRTTTPDDLHTARSCDPASGPRNDE